VVGPIRCRLDRTEPAKRPGQLDDCLRHRRQWCGRRAARQRRRQRSARRHRPGGGAVSILLEYAARVRRPNGRTSHRRRGDAIRLSLVREESGELDPDRRWGVVAHRKRHADTASRPERRDPAERHRHGRRSGRHHFARCRSAWKPGTWRAMHFHLVAGRPVRRRDRRRRDRQRERSARLRVERWDERLVDHHHRRSERHRPGSGAIHGRRQSDDVSARGNADGRRIALHHQTGSRSTGAGQLHLHALGDDAVSASRRQQRSDYRHGIVANLRVVRVDDDVVADDQLGRERSR
jgi:hypothetical protein